MSYTQSDAAIDTCGSIANRLRKVDLSELSNGQLIDLLEDIYGDVSDVEELFDENGYMTDDDDD